MLVSRLISKIILLVLLLTSLCLDTNLSYSNPSDTSSNFCPNFFTSFLSTNDISSIQQKYLTRLEQAKTFVSNNIQERTNPLVTNSSEHSFPKLESDPTAISSIKAGVTQLYLKEELQNLVRFYRINIEKMISVWLGIITGVSSLVKEELKELNKKLIDLNVELKEHSDNENVIQNSIQAIEERISYLTLQNPLLNYAPTYRLNALLDRFTSKVQQELLSGKVNLDNVSEIFVDEKKLPEIPNQISKTVENLRTNFKKDELERFDTNFKTIASKYHEYWTSHFNFGGYETIYKLSVELEKYRIDLLNKLKYALIFLDLQNDFQNKVNRRTTKVVPFTTFTQEPNSDISFHVGPSVAGTYGIKTAGVMIYPRSGYNTRQYHPKVYFLHGATTFHSNVKSFSDLIPVAYNSYFLNPMALDIWGSMEKYGIAITNLDPNKPEQLAFYMENFYKQIEANTKIQAPLIIGGRSSGSSTEFIHAFYYHLANKPISTDLLYLVSFSNFLTSEGQLNSVKEQERQGLLTLVPESDTRIDTLYKAVLKDLDYIKENSPELLVKNGFGDNIINVQGERDLDGGKTVVQDLIRFRDTYTPLAHIYVLKDPLKDYPEFAKFLEQFGQGEASHFLYNSNPNMSLESIEPLIPEDLKATLPSDRSELIKLLPRYKDQLSEVIALKYAMLDYLINSPFTSYAQREKLYNLRLELTGSTSDFAYFEWFINKEKERFAKRQEENKDYSITFKDIIEAKDTDKDSVLYRYQRVYNYVVNELKRAQDLKIKYNL